MLTIFAIPKAFDRAFQVIQRNAIQSWILLDRSCEVILFGDELGTRQVASELRVRHIPSVMTNEFGTPLLNNLFDQAKSLARNPILGYVNSDIILMSDFIQAVRRVVSWRKRFLMVGQRQNTKLSEPIEFDEQWEVRVRDHVIKYGDSYAGIDYFVFPRDLWGEIPPFAIGRLYWDDWPIYAARLRKAVVIDATPVVMAAHQWHPTGHSQVGGVERRRNWSLMAGAQNFSISNATHILRHDGPQLTCRSCFPSCVCGPYLGGVDEH